jgi:L-fuculose-phosphate aldolase
MDGNRVSGHRDPSSELGMHLFLYRERPDIRSVVHAHPPTATGFSVAGIPLTQCVLPEVVIKLGAVPIAPYGTPGGPEISEPIRQYVKDYDAYLLENHGATTLGSDVMDAYFKMETLEHFARILFVARQLGGTKVLDSEQVAKLIEIRDKLGLRGPTPACDVQGVSAEPGRAPAGEGEIPTLRTRSAGGSEREGTRLPSSPKNENDLVSEITRRVISELGRQG